MVTRNLETGASRETATNELGTYNFSTLPPGTYTVEVRATGFRTFAQTGIRVAPNNTVRVNAVLILGDVTESVTVSSDAAQLQTEGAQVRRELNQAMFNSTPIPLGRNYQLLFGTLPVFSPPNNANSLAANPSRAVVYSVNGTSHHGNNVRIDGATSNNPNLPQNTALNPTLESIEVVNIVTNSFDAEQGLAGGAAVNVQIKSGSNDVHGSAFWYHNDQAISAYPYFSDRTQSKPKFISNQFGGTVGGPIRKNRVFFFASYERTNEHSNATRFLTVPTPELRRGDLSRSLTPIYDPFSGAAFDPARPTAYGADRVAFPGNQIPLSRFSGPTRRMLDMPDWALPNATGEGALGISSNYLGNIKYFAKRDQLDSKVNFNLTNKLTAFARLSYFYVDQDNPPPFGLLGGPNVHPTNSRTGFGFGPTYSGTVSATYVADANLVFDAYYGYLLQDTTAGPPDLTQNIGRDLLGIPGTNGESELEGGMVRLFIDGFAQLGYPQTSPFFHNHTQHQFVINGNLILGAHDLRFGADILRTTNNSEEVSPPSGTGPAGAFWFRRDTTTLRGGPAGNDFNAFAAFLLGLPREAGRGILVDRCRVGGGARCPALATVRRSNCTCGFPACQLSRRRSLLRCNRRNQFDQVHKPILAVQFGLRQLFPAAVPPTFDTDATKCAARSNGRVG